MENYDKFEEKKMIITPFGNFYVGNTPPSRQGPIRVQADGGLLVYNVGASNLRLVPVRYVFNADPHHREASHERFLRLKTFNFEAPTFDLKVPPLEGFPFTIEMDRDGHFFTNRLSVAKWARITPSESPRLARAAFLWFIDGKELRLPTVERRERVFAHLRKFLVQIIADIIADREDTLTAATEERVIITNGIMTALPSYVRNYTDLPRKTAVELPPAGADRNVLAEFFRNALFTHSELIERAQRAFKAYATRYIGAAPVGQAIDPPGTIATVTHANLSEKRQKLANDGNGKVKENARESTQKRMAETAEEIEKANARVFNLRLQAILEGSVSITEWAVPTKPNDYAYVGRDASMTILKEESPAEE